MATETLEDFAGWAEKKAAQLATMDFAAPLGQVRDDLYASLYAGFQESHDPDGQPWTPLVDSFARPLFGTKAIMIAMVLAAHRNAMIRPTSMVVEVTSEIAPLHNIGKKKRPQREFLGFGERQLEAAAETIVDHAAAAAVKE